MPRLSAVGIPGLQAGEDVNLDDMRENTEAKSKLAWLRTVGVKRIAKQPQEEQ